MKDYFINQDTLALLPLGKKKTIVYENHDCYVIDKRISKIMDANCEYNGSSLAGRIKGTYNMTGFNYKTPIIVSEDEPTVFFPTCSPRLKECAWINVGNINRINDLNDKCRIEFLNNESLEIDSTYRIINNQYLKSLSLTNAFKNRKK